jgi:hypothetical protein
MLQCGHDDFGAGLSVGEGFMMVEFDAKMLANVGQFRRENVPGVAR